MQMGQQLVLMLVPLMAMPKMLQMASMQAPAPVFCLAV